MRVSPSSIPMTLEGKQGASMSRLAGVMLLAPLLDMRTTHAQTGRVLLDMTVQVLPGSPNGHCLYVEAGRFVVEARLVGENRSPTHFYLGPAYVPSSLDMRITSANVTSSSVRVESGIYCYTITYEDVEPTPDTASDGPPTLDYLVAVRLIWLPGIAALARGRLMTNPRKGPSQLAGALPRLIACIARNG